MVAAPAPMAGEAVHGVKAGDIGQSAAFAAGGAAPVRPVEAASRAPWPQAMAAGAKGSDGSADDRSGAGTELPVLQASAAAAGAVVSNVVTEAAQAAAPAHAAAAGAPPPVEQVAAAVVNITKSPDSNPQVTLHLQPGELGAVEIRIERTAAGLTHIDITAAKPETLAALQSSQAQLHQSLDLAGVPAAGRSVTFHLPEASPAQTATAAGLTDAGGFGAGQPGTQSESGGRGGFPGQPRQTQDSGPVEHAAPAASTLRPQRIGLDITA
jgi:hypothetical protein